jgi:alkylation response protein AidB-like acyl-CoA dehydrogenase
MPAGVWLAGLPEELALSEPPIERAILAAVRAAVPAHAVAAGHQAALRALFPELPASGIVAFCASEREGAHPRAIEARLSPDGSGGFRLDGEKRWATLAPAAATLLVIASEGREGDRNHLRVALIPSSRAGVAVEPMPRTAFLPELEHATVTLRGVAVAASEVLPGDGYLDAVKPFRTVEDLHVAAALVAFTLGAGVRAGWPEPTLERQLALLATALHLATESPREPATHLALAGWLGLVELSRALDAPLWERGDPGLAAAWRRDTSRAVAATARELRRARAWERLRG